MYLLFCSFDLSDLTTIDVANIRTCSNELNEITSKDNFKKGDYFLSIGILARLIQGLAEFLYPPPPQPITFRVEKNCEPKRNF